MARRNGTLGLALVAAIALNHSLFSATPGRAIIQAVRDDNQSLVAGLLGRGADVNAQEPDGSTALAWAAIRANADVARILLAAGADPNLTNSYGIGPLALAIENAARGIVQLLLDNGADPNLPRENGETPLMTATRMNQVDVMELLLGHGANANAREVRFGQTSLMWAAGNSGAVRLLLEHGADVSVTTRTWDV